VRPMSLHQSACRTKEVKSDYDAFEPARQPLSASFAATIHQFSFRQGGPSKNQDESSLLSHLNAPIYLGSADSFRFAAHSSSRRSLRGTS